LFRSKLCGKRVVFRGKGLVEVENFDVREPKKDEVLIRTVSTLISPGTETAFLMALPNTSGVFPQYPGYSNAGIVERIGDEVTSVRVGDKVASSKPHASHVIAKEDKVFTIPDAVSYDEASFFKLGAIALQGVRKGMIELGESVVVIGQGLIGILALQLAKLSGGIPVIGIDLYDYRLSLSSKLGADYTINPLREKPKDRILELTDGKGASVVIEATGNPEAIPVALKLAGRCGRVILLGSTRGENTVNFYRDVHTKGLHIIGAHNNIRPRYESSYGFWTIEDDSRLILKLIEKRLLKVKDLITLKMSFNKVKEAYRRLIELKGETMGIILDWSEASRQ